MRRQDFKMIAQNSIDAIDEKIKLLRKQFYQNESNCKDQLKIKIEDHEQDLELLISKYNALDTSNEEDWEFAMNAFNLSSDTLKDKILETF